MTALLRCLTCLLLTLLPACAPHDIASDAPLRLDRITPPQRLNARSPWYPIQNEQTQLLTNYCGWDTQRNQRIVHEEIGTKVKQMVSDADGMIVATFFLFDNLHAPNPAGDYVEELTQLLIAAKTNHPHMPVVLILDTFHKGWGYRRSEAIERLRAVGVDVFYSDVLESRAAGRLGIWENLHEAGQSASQATGGLLNLPWEAFTRIPMPYIFDGQFTSIATITNGLLFKANHRKAIVIKRGDTYETLVTSWNPHNPSLLHENHALTLTGPLACYVYEVMREDIRKSLTLGGTYVSLSKKSSTHQNDYLHHILPALPDSAWHAPEPPETNPPQPEAAFATEEAIEPLLLNWLDHVEPGDRVRIQMFYLSRVPVIHAILDAAARTNHPIQILLDPNRVGINYSRDGAPNAPVADYLLERARKENARIEIRWYVTHGEQNHAKAFTITNEQTGKYLLSLGSTNWTRKNLAGINLEDNLFLRNAPNLTRQFNDLFDRQWSNTDPGILYTAAWDDPTYNFHHHTGRDKWATQKWSGLCTPSLDSNGRPQLLEQEWVHW